MSTVEAMIDRERFEGKISRTEGCWLWMGGLFPNGYGFHRLAGRSELAHRVAYTLWKGDIPKGLTLDHLCRNPQCVNPNHLEVVPLRTNILRGDGPTARNARKKVCIRGHVFTSENTFVRRGGWRTCRLCQREHDQRYKQKKKVGKKANCEPRQIARGERVPQSKLTEEIVRRIRDLTTQGQSQRILAEVFGVDRRTVNRAVRREAWSHVE